MFMYEHMWDFFQFRILFLQNFIKYNCIFLHEFLNKREMFDIFRYQFCASSPISQPLFFKVEIRSNCIQIHICDKIRIYRIIMYNCEKHPFARIPSVDTDMSIFLFSPAPTVQ